MLDWEKAFDEIQHDKPLLALKRIGLSSKIQSVIADCNKDPGFSLRITTAAQEKKTIGWNKTRMSTFTLPFHFSNDTTCIDKDIQRDVSQDITSIELLD